MSYTIQFAKAAIKFLKKQDKKSQQRILQTIQKLPSGMDIKRLQGFDLYRVRVGDVRIIYSIDDVIEIITIENINNRGDVYKQL